MSIKIIVLFIVILIAAIVIYFFVETIPPAGSTRSSIIKTAWRIREYVKIHGQLPINIHNIPKHEGYANSIKDWWGNELKYTIGDDNSVTLTSFGKDAEPGDEGENADIVGSFNPKVENDYIPFVSFMKREGMIRE